MDEQFEQGPAFRGHGDTYEALAPAAGPWSAGHCHGGACAALIGHVATGIVTREPMLIVRLTTDFLGPIPIGEPLHVSTATIKDGRRTQLVTVEVSASGRLVARATALKTADLAYSVVAPENTSSFEPRGGRLPVAMPGAFSSQFTVIPIIGGFGHMMPGKVWFRFNSEIVAGHEVEPIARAMACADFANAISMGLPYSEWLYPTIDLNVNLTRPPVDDWILIDAKNEMTETARMFCQAVMSDSAGVFGHCLQSVLVERRAVPTLPEVDVDDLGKEPMA